MNTLQMLVVLGSLVALMLMLAWIGWRYFVTDIQPHAESMAGPATVAPDFLHKRPNPFREWIQATVAILANRLIWLVFGLACLGIFGALALSGRFTLDPLRAFSFERESHITQAMNPERLVPPPPLPPNLFVSAERPALESADRDWSKLDPAFMQAVLQLFARMEARGFQLALLEGYRSPDRQDMLADLGSNVTNARGMQSRHQYGLAADIAPMKDGRLMISERDPWAFAAYQALGQEAEALGLTWGGRWGLRDYGHVEWSRTPSRG